MPISVRLDDRTERVVRRLATRTGRTTSDVIREAIAMLEAQETPSSPQTPTAYDRLAHLIGGTGSGHADLSEATGEKFRQLLRLKHEPKRESRLRARRLVDAGPLVAVLDRDDAHHDDCVAALRTIRDPLVTVWPALTEAMNLLGFAWERQRALWEMVETDILRIVPLDREDAARMRALMDKHRDLPMDLADAALVRVAERDAIHRLFTLDRRHFGVYRPSGVKRFSFLP